jgi:hypothetical protein
MSVERKSFSIIFDKFNLHIYDVKHVLGLWLAFVARITCVLIHITNNINLIECNLKIRGQGEALVWVSYKIINTWEWLSTELKTVKPSHPLPVIQSCIFYFLLSIELNYLYHTISWENIMHEIEQKQTHVFVYLLFSLRQYMSAFCVFQSLRNNIYRQKSGVYPTVSWFDISEP